MKKDDIRSLISPKQDIAEEELVIIQDAVTKIKEIIVQDINQGVSKEITSGRIREIIKDLSANIPDKELVNEIKRGLAISTQRWYYMFNVNIKTINEAYKRNLILNLAKQSLAKFETPKTKTYTFDIDSLIEDLGGKQITEQIRKTFDNFRNLLDKSSKGIAVIRDYDKQVRSLTKVLASDPPMTNRLTKDGKPYRVNLRNRAEMAIRYTANLQDLAKLKKSGVKLVWTSSHADASPRCRKYQGKLYSLDGTSGVIDGNRYTPIDAALLGPLGDGNGIISGYNCRHRLIEYKSGSNPPVEYTEEEIKREYAIDQKQRSYENRIRLLKTEERLMRANGYSKQASQLRKRWRKLNKDYEVFSLKHERAFYPKRTRISTDESEVTTKK